MYTWTHYMLFKYWYIVNWKKKSHLLQGLIHWLRTAISSTFGLLENPGLVSSDALSGLQWGVCSENMRGGMVFFHQSIDSFFVRSIIIPLLSHHIMYEFLGLSNDVCNPVENRSSHRDHRISKSALNWTGCLFFIDSIKNAD